jgi:hypothetical protein
MGNPLTRKRVLRIRHVQTEGERQALRAEKTNNGNRAVLGTESEYVAHLLGRVYTEYEEVFRQPIRNPFPSTFSFMFTFLSFQEVWNTLIP